jgi:hypothetical protein
LRTDRLGGSSQGEGTPAGRASWTSPSRRSSRLVRQVCSSSTAPSGGTGRWRVRRGRTINGRAQGPPAAVGEARREVVMVCYRCAQAHPRTTSAVSADLDDSGGTRIGLVATGGPVRRTAGPPLLTRGPAERAGAARAARLVTTATLSRRVRLIAVALCPESQLLAAVRCSGGPRSRDPNADPAR